jgi:hypothetical protein
MNMGVEHPGEATAAATPTLPPDANSAFQPKAAERNIAALPKEYLSFKQGAEEYGIDIYALMSSEEMGLMDLAMH